MPDPSPFSTSGTAGGATRPTEPQGKGVFVLHPPQSTAGAVADRAKDIASSVADKAQQAASSVAHTAEQVASSVASTTEQVASRVRDTATDAWETSSEYAGDQFGNLTRWVKRNPGTALCLGFAVGCCLGYFLVTRRER
jgi:ElaB/YqjD/DUF883 family membrane-anchored ribosome-binding protein